MPGSVLTSMLKRVDVAAYETFKDAMDGNFSSGVKILGLAEGGVDWAEDSNNAPLITADIKSAIEAARADILSGKVTVHNYETHIKLSIPAVLQYWAVPHVHDDIDSFMVSDIQYKTGGNSALPPVLRLSSGILMIWCCTREQRCQPGSIGRHCAWHCWRKWC